MQMLHVVGGGRVEAPDGLMLTSTAAGIVRTPLMRLQEPLSGILNYWAPYAKLVPALQPEKLLCNEELVLTLLHDVCITECCCFRLHPTCCILEWTVPTNEAVLALLR
jgi:hypothetical protein